MEINHFDWDDMKLYKDIIKAVKKSMKGDAYFGLRNLFHAGYLSEIEFDKLANELNKIYNDAINKINDAIWEALKIGKTRSAKTLKIKNNGQTKTAKS